VGGDPARCYAGAAAGLTTVVYVDDPTSARDGAIVDADVELNGVGFAISNDGVSLGTAGCKADLKNTLTHELGHLLGLEHTCLAPGDPPRTDGQGAAVPACQATTAPGIVDATMYNYQDCGETKKQTLEADDVGGVCAMYPIAKAPGSCSPVNAPGAGCCDATGTPGGSAALAALTVLGLAARRGRVPKTRPRAAVG
jgi:hypothetical protein